MVKRQILLLFIILFAVNVTAQQRYTIDLSKLKLTSEKNLNYKIWGIQKTFAVPNVQVIDSLLLYRTEYHNGTENAVLIVIYKIEKARLSFVDVIEEGFELSGGDYYYNKIESTEGDRIRFKVLHHLGGKEEVISRIAYDIKVKRITEGRGSIFQRVDSIESIKKMIQEGTY